MRQTYCYEREHDKNIIIVARDKHLWRRELDTDLGPFLEKGDAMSAEPLDACMSAATNMAAERPEGTMYIICVRSAKVCKRTLKVCTESVKVSKGSVKVREGP